MNEDNVKAMTKDNFFSVFLFALCRHDKHSDQIQLGEGMGPFNLQVSIPHKEVKAET